MGKLRFWRICLEWRLWRWVAEIRPSIKRGYRVAMWERWGTGVYVQEAQHG